MITVSWPLLLAVAMTTWVALVAMPPANMSPTLFMVNKWLAVLATAAPCGERIVKARARWIKITRHTVAA